MLSVTHTINDVKRKLGNNFEFFDYETDLEFTDAIISVSEDVQFSVMIPRIGQDHYLEIQAKDKIGLSREENSIYWAEVFEICHAFLSWSMSKSQQMQTSSNDSIAVEGYKRSQSSGAGSTNAEKSLGYYRAMADRYWSYAGYKTGSLFRTFKLYDS